MLGAMASGTGGGNSLTTFLPKSVAGNSTVVSFKKTRILYSYGYATANIQGTDSIIDSITTPLALIPVDFLPFYLTQSEFINLPFGSSITNVWCKVYPLGTRTAFDTGTTLSGSATSEYIPIGLCGIGLNKDFYGKNRLYSTDPTKPMKPTGISKIKPELIVKKYYTDVASTTVLVPRSISEYFVHEWNMEDSPDKKKYPDYQIHDAGVARVDEKVDTFLINSMINKPIIQYVYTPKNGRINAGKLHYVPYDRRKYKLESEFIRGRSHALQFFSNADKSPAIGILGLYAETTPPMCQNSIDEQYKRQIENYGTFDPQTGVTSYAAQPQVHVGIQATPQLYPATAESDFLNSCAYWRVECGCTISFGLSSAFTKHTPITWPREVKFVESATPGYTDGQTLFGNTDAKSGNITTIQDVIDDEYELISHPKKKKTLE